MLSRSKVKTFGFGRLSYDILGHALLYGTINSLFDHLLKHCCGNEFTSSKEKNLVAAILPL